MLVLSFRDLSAPRGGAVTPAAMLELPAAADAAFDWNDPASLRERLRGGSAAWLGGDRVQAALSGRPLCFLLHGFNVGRDKGYAGLGAWAKALIPDAGAGLAIPVLWPGDWMLPGVNYPFELADVRSTAARFSEFLAGPAAGAAGLSFVTHSMGARVALETLARPIRRAPVEALLLTAPAVDEGALDDPRFAPAVESVHRIVVVSSIKDSVLRDAFPLGDRVEAALWRGEHASTRALGAFGPRLKPGSMVAAKLRWFSIDAADDYGHDDYVPAPWRRDQRPEGFTPRRTRMAGFLRGALASSAFAPDWPGERRPG